MTVRMTWSQFTERMARLSALPGYDRMGEINWVDYYALVSSYFPHELSKAVTAYLSSPDVEFFPPPGKLLARMQSHRNAIGGNDWDSTLRALLKEAHANTPIGGARDARALDAGS